jgi:menaquinone-dependent protoporphyrinogen IX oxidase
LGIFFVSLATASGMKKEDQEIQKITDKFLAKKGIKPLLTAQSAGALKHT